MIFSIGYQNILIEDFARLCGRLGIANIVDTRSQPSSRKKGWSRLQLEARFALPRPGAAGYEWRGDRLGGRGPGPTKAGIEELVDEDRAGRTTMLLCLEEAPGDCHRHARIAVKMLPHVDVRHIYGEEFTIASELQRSLEAGDDDEPSMFSLAMLLPPGEK